jgi:molybdopterin-guanine dinucleotide biosynthesis protein A
MTGIILSGGGSRRMGTNKAFVRVGGERLIDRTVRVFRTIFQEVIIVTVKPLDYLDQQATIVTDIVPQGGAIGGLYTGLFYANGDYAFVSACDMPFLNAAFIEFMISQTAGYDVVVPAPPDGLQPLHAIYARRCLPVIRSHLDRKRLKIIDLYPKLRIHSISPEILRRFDPEGRMFMNVNTPEDMLNLTSA